MALDRRSRPLRVPPGGGEMVWFLGQPLEVKVTGEQTGGAYAVTEAEPEPGFSPALHAHRNEDEAIYVLAGDFLITVDGQQLRCGPGTFVHIPKGAVHTHENIGRLPGRTLTIYFPAGFERVFRELGEPLVDRAAGPSKPPDPAALVDRADAYGLEFERSPAQPQRGASSR